jgi:hypothetical protein
MSIKAEIHTDCRTAEANFDATHWFQQASDNEILDLADCGWGGGLAADDVAEYYNDRKSDLGVEEVFTALHILRRKQNIGFECNVDGEDALAWLKEHRPWLHAIIVDQPEEKAYVCTYAKEAFLTLPINGENLMTALKKAACREAREVLPGACPLWMNAEFYFNERESKAYVVVRPAKDQQQAEETSELDPEQAALGAILGTVPDAEILTFEGLDDLVHDVLAAKASEVINGGTRAQVAFLLKEGSSEAEIKAAMEA